MEALECTEVYLTSKLRHEGKPNSMRNPSLGTTDGSSVQLWISSTFIIGNSDPDRRNGLDIRFG